MELRAITKKDYDEYLEKALKKYEQELITSGATLEQAQAAAQNSFKSILPDGFETKGHYFNYAYIDDVNIGFIWYGFREENTAYIYDFYINEEARGKGYSKLVMLECEKAAKENGAKYMRLHVFGHNIIARKLYEKLDYYPTSIQMKKDL